MVANQDTSDITLKNAHKTTQKKYKTSVYKWTLRLQAGDELCLSPTTYLQLCKALVSSKEHLLQLVTQTNIVHLSPRHIPLALLSNFVSDEIKRAIVATWLKYLKTDFQLNKPELSKVYEDRTLRGFIK